MVVFFFAGFLVVVVAGAVLDAAFGAGVGFGFGVAAGFACGAAKMPVAKSAVSDTVASNFFIVSPFQVMVSSLLVGLQLPVRVTD